jgi:hypothetical protein
MVALWDAKNHKIVYNINVEACSENYTYVGIKKFAAVSFEIDWWYPQSGRVRRSARTTSRDGSPIPSFAIVWDEADGCSIEYRALP